MKDIGIFYGSTTGTTEEVAHKLGKLLGVSDEDIHNVADTALSVLGDYRLMVLGSSTWGSGELQDDWYDFLDGAGALNLKDHKMAIFGLGDESMTDTFCNAVGEIRKRMEPTEAVLVGEYPADVYDYEHSEATDGNTMYGLLLDEVNRPEITDKRLADWAARIKKA